jgi:hypothetical protein
MQKIITHIPLLQTPLTSKQKTDFERSEEKEKKEKMKSLLIYSLAFVICLVPKPSAAFHQHKSHGNERMEDGAFSPRDHGHFSEDGMTMLHKKLFHIDSRQLLALFFSDHHHSEFDHEAILGSVKEAEEFHDLKPEESIRRLAILIRKMDLNGDEFIDRHELKGNFSLLMQNTVSSDFLMHTINLRSQHGFYVHSRSSRRRRATTGLMTWTRITTKKYRGRSM